MYDGMMGRFYRFTEVISRLVYLNALWVLFTLLGLGIFGFFPSTIVLFTIVKRIVIEDKDTPIFRMYWNAYKEVFLKANVLGLILSSIGYVLYLDFVFLPVDSAFYVIIRTLLILCSILYMIVLIYIFPLYVHYEAKIRLHLKNALLIGISYFHYSLGLFVFIAIWYYLNSSIPLLIPLFSVSFYSYINMSIVGRVLDNLTQAAHTD